MEAPTRKDKAREATVDFVLSPRTPPPRSDDAVSPITDKNWALLKGEVNGSVGSGLDIVYKITKKIFTFDAESCWP